MSEAPYYLTEEQHGKCLLLGIMIYKHQLGLDTDELYIAYRPHFNGRQTGGQILRRTKDLGYTSWVMFKTPQDAIDACLDHQKLGYTWR